MRKLIAILVITLTGCRVNETEAIITKDAAKSRLSTILSKIGPYSGIHELASCGTKIRRIGQPVFSCLGQNLSGASCKPQVAIAWAYFLFQDKRSHEILIKELPTIPEQEKENKLLYAKVLGMMARPKSLGNIESLLMKLEPPLHKDVLIKFWGNVAFSPMPARPRRMLYLLRNPNVKEKHAELIKKGDACIGMSESDVQASIGAPTDISTSVGKWGVHKTYIYRIGRKSMYLFFENGILTSWSD